MKRIDAQIVNKIERRHLVNEIKKNYKNYKNEAQRTKKRKIL